MTAVARRILVFTGVTGLAGGLITLALGTSCDAECMPDDRPSILLSIHTTDGTVTIPQTATSVTYRFRGFDDDGDAPQDSLTTPAAQEQGYCLDSDCTRWVVGTDQAGVFDIEAVACGKTYKKTVRVPLAEDGCHPEVQYVPIEVTCEPQPPLRGEIRCDKMARPSVFVFVGRAHDDLLEPVPVDRVWYEHLGRRAEATCATPDSSGRGCAMWTAGWELEGRVSVSTQWCDTVVSEVASVGLTDDGCHVDTEFMILPVSTRGCLTGETPDGPDDPPRGPGAFTDDPRDADAPPAGGPDELRKALPDGDPIGPKIHG